jgi:hypothetical protein
MVKDPGKVIKLEGGTSTRKDGTSHRAGKILPAPDRKTSDHKGTSGPPKSPPKKEK